MWTSYWSEILKTLNIVLITITYPPRSSFDMNFAAVALKAIFTALLDSTRLTCGTFLYFVFHRR